MESIVSVVMPVWRPEPAWLRAAVQSVLAEHACELELVVVDDGNETPVADLLDRADPRLHIVRIEHGGQSAARNAGIAVARGTHLRFVACDDVVTPGSTAHLVAQAGRDSVVAYGATELCGSGLEPESVLICDVQGPAVHECLTGRLPVLEPALLFPRHVVDAAGPWDPTFETMADWEWILRALEHAPLRGDHRIVYRYRRHAESVQGRSSNADAEAANHRLVDAYFMRHAEQRGGAFERRTRAAVHLKYARTYLRDGRPAIALDRVVRGSRLDPAAGVRTLGALALRELRRAVGTRRTTARGSRRRSRSARSSPQETRGTPAARRHDG